MTTINMKVQRVDLKPNRELIDNDFNGYKLSLDSRPIQKIPIKDVNVIKLKESQYSFQHIKSVSLHSHLHQDPWDLDTVYYVNHDRAIMQVKSTQDSIDEPRKVFEIPKSSPSPDDVGQFNVTLQFISEDYVVLSDGAGTLYFLNASNRAKGSHWKEEYSTSSCSSNKPFVLMHSILRTPSIIDCLLLHIDDRLATNELNDDNDANLPFVTVLEWTSFTLNNNGCWELTRTRRVAACGNVDYAALEGSGRALCIVSEKQFKFIFDSERPLTQETKKQDDPPVKENGFLYAWSQTSEELTLWLKFDEKTVKSDIDYKLTSSHLYIGLKSGQALVNGLLFSTVDTETSVWTWKDGQVEVILTKANPGLVWQELVKGDDGGTEILDTNLISSVLEKLAMLSSGDQVSTSQGSLVKFNPQQLEECDDFPVNSYKMVRIEDDTHQVTHEVSLSSHQWLFSRVKLPNEFPVFCIRHDVDGLLWQPSNVFDWENHQRQWQCEHVATFNALGYVLASKQDKKFLSCSPECTFVALCDARLYLYLYFQPSSVESDLRNRKTGKRVQTVAKQQLVTLDTSNILGLQVSNHNVFVLTEEHLYVVNIVRR